MNKRPQSLLAPRRRRRRVVVAALAVVVVGTGLAVSVSLGASQAGPPRFTKVLNKEVFSTRAFIALDLRPEGLATEWSAEYSTSLSGPWTKVDETGGGEAGEASVEIGAEDHKNPADVTHIEVTFLRDLKPDTTYYARFLAKNADGEAKNAEGEPGETIQFKTLPIAKPEIDVSYIEYNPSTTTFKLDHTTEVTDTTFGLEAKIDANGAAATYHFEYAEHESGPWTQFSSGATGTISEGEEYAWLKARASGLTPERTYYVRLTATNAKGETKAIEYINGLSLTKVFVTPTAKPGVATPSVRNVTPDSAYVTASVFPHGSETVWRLEYSESEGGPWSPVPGGGGTVSLAEAEATPYNAGAKSTSGVRLAGLSASSTYYVRATATNTCAVGAEGCGSVTSGVSSFTTIAPASVSASIVHGVHGEALRLLGSVDPNSGPTLAEQVVTLEGSPTGGSFTLTFDGQSTGWTATGTTTAGSDEVTELATMRGSSELGEVVSGPGIPPGTTLVSISDEDHVLVLSQAATASATGVSLTEPLPQLPYDAEPETVRDALEGLPGGPGVGVEGPDGGPYTVFFSGESGVSEPLIEGSGSGLVPAGGSVHVVTTLAGGAGYGAHYHFEYVSQRSFAAHGWGEAVQGPEGEVGAAAGSVFEGYDLVGATPGETYRYRVVAKSDAPGASLLESEEQSLTVPPAPSAGGEAEACPNAAFRVEASAHLPDCRAYEQLTPPEKHGAEEPFQYGVGLGSTVSVGADGEHVVLEAPNTYYLAGPETGQSPFLFSRGSLGWGMLAGALQPETGVRRDFPQVYSTDVTQVAFASEYNTSDVGVSPTVEYGLGPVGGPYTTVASVPSAEAGPNQGWGWVAGTPSLSKLVFATQDRTLTSEEQTGTASGSDLYEYTPAGGLRQLNVIESEGETQTIGSCGARVVNGAEDKSEQTGQYSGPHSLSADGSRVFFEAVPGNNCSEARHLYMRVNGAETVDIGAYTFLATNPNGSRVLVQSGAGEALLYDSETESAPTPLPGLGGFAAGAGGLTVSSDLSTVYFTQGDSLYRYDIQAGRLEFLVQASGRGEEGVSLYSSPDGRYAYFDAESVGGLPGSGSCEEGDLEPCVQVYRYDSVEHAVECISCASPFDSEPRLSSFLHSHNSKTDINGGGPLFSSISGNGQYAFFTTPAALVPQDIDGEISIESCLEDRCKGGLGTDEYDERGQGTNSPSSDIYEWRAQGIHGCTALAGCLSLISDGRGGFMTLLLGTADEGRDVFLYTREKLSPSDQGVEANIFDAREGGGDPPPPPRPLECEGDSCATPPAPPLDSTPSSMTFSGVGNVVPAATTAPPSKKKAASKKKGKANKKRARSKAKRSSHKVRHKGGKKQ